MKQYFVIYPHCYFSTTGNNIFIFNPITKKNITGEVELFKEARFNNGILLIDNKNINPYIDIFIKECIEKELGYVYNSSSRIKPFSRTYNIRYISSLQKMRNAIGYNEGFNIARYISEITIFTGNKSLSLFKDSLFTQINYPIYNSHLQYDIKIIRKYLFPNLNTITITGDINNKVIVECLDTFPHKQIVIRTYIDNNQLSHLKHLLERYQSINIEVLIDDFKIINSLFSIIKGYNDRISIVPIIKSVDDFNSYSSFDYLFIYKPLLFDIVAQKSLIDSILINKEDIINTEQTIDDIYIKEVVNQRLFGCITIDTQGSVYTDNDLIGSIKNNFLTSLNKWLHKKNNPWFYTRNSKIECMDCCLRALCPPITIYERECYIKTACEV